MDLKLFSQNLTFLRKQHNITTADLAKVIKIPEDVIVGWELGMAEPEAKDILRVSKVFNVDAIDLANTNLNKNVVTHEPEVDTPKKSNNYNNNEKGSVLPVVMKAIVIALCAFTFITFTFKMFSVSLNELSSYVDYFDILTPKTFSMTTLFAWLIFFILIYNIVDNIILCSSKRLRNSHYNKISKILQYSLNGFALLLWIIVLIYNRDCTFHFAAIWMLAVLIAIIVLNLIIDLCPIIKAKNIKLNNTIFIVLSMIVIIVLWLVALDIPFNIEYTGHDGYYYSIASDIMDVALFPFACIVVLSLAVCIFGIILPFINGRNKKVEKVLNIINLILSLVLFISAMAVFIIITVGYKLDVSYTVTLYTHGGLYLIVAIFMILALVSFILSIKLLKKLMKQ